MNLAKSKRKPMAAKAVISVTNKMGGMIDKCW